MRIRLHSKATNITQYPDLAENKIYDVLGIEADDYRIVNDEGKPYLYPHNFFEIVDSSEPDDWITEYGDEGERYSYPPELNEPGFFEDYFDGNSLVIVQFHKYLAKVSQMRQKQFISQLLETQITLYKKSEQERHRLHQKEWNAQDTEGSILGEAERYSSTIAGIATSVIQHHHVKDISEKIMSLKHNSLDHFPELFRWMREEGSDYPKFLLYIQQCEHLRMLLLEVLQDTGMDR